MVFLLGWKKKVKESQRPVKEEKREENETNERKRKKKREKIVREKYLNIIIFLSVELL